MSSKEQRASNSAQERILESILGLALQQQKDLNDTPTIASVESVEDALASLPSSLPSKGLGDEKAYELVKDKLLPALARGQAGPRYALPV